MDEEQAQEEQQKAAKRSVGWAAMLVGVVAAIVIIALGSRMAGLNTTGRDAYGQCESFAIAPDHDRPCESSTSAWPTALLVIGGGVGLAGIFVGVVLIARNPRRYTA